MRKTSSRVDRRKLLAEMASCDCFSDGGSSTSASGSSPRSATKSLPLSNFSFRRCQKSSGASNGRSIMLPSLGCPTYLSLHHRWLRWVRFLSQAEGQTKWNPILLLELPSVDADHTCLRGWCQCRVLSKRLCALFPHCRSVFPLFSGLNSHFLGEMGRNAVG